MPGLRVRVFFKNSSRGTVYCKSASAGTQTAFSRPPASAPSTDSRRYSYSRPAPSTGRSMKSRGGKTAAVSPSALRSSAKWVASASPGVTMQSTRPRSFCSAAYSSARPAGGSPNSAAGPGAARLAEIFWYSAVFFSRDSYIVDLLSQWAEDDCTATQRNHPLYLLCASPSLPSMMSLAAASKSGYRSAMALASSGGNLPSTQSARS